VNQQAHYFFAVKIPEQTKLQMKEYMDTLKTKFPFKRWVHHEDLHITLAFLGFAPSDQLITAIENVKEAVRGLKPLNLELDSLGIFGSTNSPRIFWVDTKKSIELELVRKHIFTACLEAGFKLETRPFRPHITLARKWEGDRPFQTDLLDKWMPSQHEKVMFEADQVVLYQTHLDRSPKYEIKEVFRLE
jgi:2'-5' RNA ligase